MEKFMELGGKSILWALRRTWFSYWKLEFLVSSAELS